MAKKILVIDDEDLITKSLQRLLSKEGYDTTVVKNGKEALGEVKKTDFDLIVSDVRMPELDGIETVIQIRGYLQKAKKKAIPELLITGYADIDKYEKAQQLKVADYIYKPFETDAFLQAVKKNIA